MTKASFSCCTSKLRAERHETFSALSDRHCSGLIPATSEGRLVDDNVHAADLLEVRQRLPQGLVFQVKRDWLEESDLEALGGWDLIEGNVLLDWFVGERLGLAAIAMPLDESATRAMPTRPMIRIRLRMRPSSRPCRGSSAVGL